MTSRMPLVAGLCAALAIGFGLAACDDDNNPGPTWDTTLDSAADTTADTHTDIASDMPDATDTTPDPTIDTATDTGTDTISDPATDDGSGSCDHNGFTSVQEYGERGTGSGGEYIYYAGQTAAAAPTDLLTIEFYYGFGSPDPLTAPGNFTLAGTTAEQNYSTCGTCVLAHTGCTTDGCTKSFYTTAGTLNLTAIGPAGSSNFTGTLTGVTMVEVTIAPSTFVSTPVPGGEGWCISSYSFNTPLVAP